MRERFLQAFILLLAGIPLGSHADSMPSGESTGEPPREVTEAVRKVREEYSRLRKLRDEGALKLREKIEENCHRSYSGYRWIHRLYAFPDGAPAIVEFSDEDSDDIVGRFSDEFYFRDNRIFFAFETEQRAGKTDEKRWYFEDGKPVLELSQRKAPSKKGKRNAAESFDHRAFGKDMETYLLEGEDGLLGRATATKDYVLGKNKCPGSEH